MNTNKIDLIKAEVEKLHGNPYYMMAVKDVLKIIDMQEEPVSEELEKAAEKDVCEVVNCCSATAIPNDHIPS